MKRRIYFLLPDVDTTRKIVDELLLARASAMIGSDIINSRIKPYEKAIDKGEILLMLDIRRDQIDEITQLISKHHPEIQRQKVDPTIPAFP